MNFSKQNNKEKIIYQTVRRTVQALPYVSKISRDISYSSDAETTKQKSIIIEFLNNKKISIQVFVVLFHTENKKIPEIALEIQINIKKSLEQLQIDYQIKNIDVIISGVML